MHTEGGLDGVGPLALRKALGDLGELFAKAGCELPNELPNEPPVDGDPLLDYEGSNLIVTPHIAWATDQARQNAIDELATNTKAFLEGRERNRIV